jgi:hypothetical protein
MQLIALLKKFLFINAGPARLKRPAPWYVKEKAAIMRLFFTAGL